MTARSSSSRIDPQPGGTSVPCAPLGQNVNQGNRQGESAGQSQAAQENQPTGESKKKRLGLSVSALKAIRDVDRGKCRRQNTAAE
jgi:hypothetical protein